jgi:hypothetical protein
MTQLRFFTNSAGTRERSFVGLAAAALIVALVLSVQCHGTGAAEKAKTADAASTPLDKGWPRLYTIGGNEITLHQPQIDEWRDYNTLFARLAVAVKPKGAKEPTLGVVELKAKTVTDHEKRLVTMYKPEITAVRFQDVDPETAAALEKTVRSVPPAREYTEIALDRVVAYVEQGQAKEEGVEVNLDPPPIFYSDREAILIAFLGAPRFSPIEGTGLEFGLNTNWDVIRDKATGQNYLLYRDGWLMTADLLKGSWEQVKKLPDDMKKLPKDEAWERVSKSVPGKKLSSIPRVFVSETPGEMIITEGRPKFRTISGTKLSAVSNSENSLFYHSGDSNFYFMAAGRWFRAKDLTGPWTAATKSLPPDFAAIPKKDPSADILASVPGTDEARDAVLLASIPKIGVVIRSEAKAVVTYDGEPDFQPIDSTSSVKYAVNTSNDVFLVGSTYYVCYEAVWFTGKSPTGPWVVADSIPKEIYSIPPTSQKYHVTYVYVYESTPTTVTCGCTSGYNGEVVSAGVVMFGMGMMVMAAHSSHYYYGYYPPYYWGYGPRPVPYYGHAHYYASPYGYGYSAHGPYGGAGYGASYNPATGVYKKGGYAYGPYGGQGYRTAYNPSTGAWAGQRGGYNAYGDSWKQSAVVKGDDWARGGSVSNGQGTMGGFQTSGGAAGVGYKGDQGSGFVVKGKEGDMYAGKDGNVYKRDENGDWSSAGGGSASPKTGEVSAGTRDAASTGTKPSAGTQPSTGTKPSTGAQPSAGAKPSAGTQPSTGAKPSTGTKPSTGAAAKPATQPSSSMQNQLNTDYKARQTGNQRAAQSSTRSAPSRSGGGGRRR